MTRKAVLSLVIVINCILCLQAQQVRESEKNQTIKMDLDLTLVNASVTYPQRRMVADLDARDIREHKIANHPHVGSVHTHAPM